MPSMSKKKSISSPCLLEFTTLMSILLKSSLSVKDAMDIMEKTAERADVRALAARLSAGMERGQSFREALDGCGRLPPVYSGLVRIGEKTGELSKAYERLADYLSEGKKLRDGLSGALVYPIIILAVGLVGGAGVSIFALPKLREIFNELGGTAMANIDKTLSSGISAISSFTAFVALAALAFVALAFAKRKNAALALKVDEIAYRLPFIGKIVQSRCLLDFSFAMESMTAGGIPLDEALGEAAKAAANAFFSASLSRARETVRKGSSLSAACAAVGSFPPYLVQWLSVGERTGRPQDVFGRLRSYYQSMSERRVKVFMSLIEPGVTLLIGAFVIILVFIFVIPLFNAMGSIMTVQ
jgi:type II secretory pathway component PulF